MELHRARAVFAFILLVCLGLLCACGAAPAAETGPELYAVRYCNGGELLREEQVPAGSAPAGYSPELEGFRFLGWTSADGQPADPSAIPVTGDVEYLAAVLPIFGRHVPFLFCDDEGFLLPDEALTCDDFSRAVSALAFTPPEAALPSGGEGADAADMREALTAYFTAEELGAFPESGSLSRGEFAVLMIALLGREGELVTCPPSAAAPVDLEPGRADFAALLEASVPHDVSASGQPWPETALSAAREAGPFLLDGSLYCCGEDGFLLRDASFGPLNFGADGRYTSGDETLDGYVSSVLMELDARYPGASRPEMLRHIYDYMLQNFRYLGRSHYGEGAVGWEDEEARMMFELGKGNCFGYAGAFRALARAIGYPANCIASALDREGGVHAWTEIKIDGVYYIFDPQLEINFGNDRYHLSYEEGARYGYRRPAWLLTPDEVAYRDVVYHEPTELGQVVAANGENGELFLIYLPYGYDETKPYRVLVYLNGADGDPYKMLGTAYQYSHGNFYFQAGITTKSYLDFLIQYGHCEPLIVVSTTTIISSTLTMRYLSLVQYTVDHFSTYAESSSVEDLIAARDYFAIAGPSTASQSICSSIPVLPDIFAYYGLFSGMYQYDEVLAAFSEKQPIRWLVMAAGEADYQRGVMENAYRDFSKLDNVQGSSLMIVDGIDHDWTAFDGAIRELLIHFAPKQRA